MHINYKKGHASTYTTLILDVFSNFKSRNIYEKLTKLKGDDDNDLDFKNKNNGQVALHKIFFSFYLVQTECVVCLSLSEFCRENMQCVGVCLVSVSVSESESESEGVRLRCSVFRWRFPLFTPKNSSKATTSLGHEYLVEEFYLNNHLVDNL